VSFWSTTDPSFWNESDLIEALVQRRASLVSEKPRADPERKYGRLLWCRYEYTNENYGSDHFSQGFFDGNDNPPWDTWIDQVGDALISWVPPPFVDRASEGISVECCDMLNWVVNRELDVPRWLLEIAYEFEAAG
jgi:hypothetical protein